MTWTAFAILAIFLNKKDTSIYTQRQWASRALCEFIYFICIFWRSQPGQQGLLGLLMFAFQITATLSRPPTPTTTRCLQKDEIQPALPLYWISIQIKVQWISPIISMNMPPTNKHTPTIICGENYFHFFPKEHIFCLALGARLLTYTIMLHYHDDCSFCTQGHWSHFAPMILTQPARFAHLNLW